MFKPWFRLLAVVLCLPVGATLGFSQGTKKQLLQLVQTISLPGVTGRLDHMEVDV